MAFHGIVLALHWPHIAGQLLLFIFYLFSPLVSAHHKIQKGWHSIALLHWHCIIGWLLLFIFNLFPCWCATKMFFKILFIPIFPGGIGWHCVIVALPASLLFIFNLFLIVPCWCASKNLSHNPSCCPGGIALALHLQLLVDCCCFFFICFPASKCTSKLFASKCSIYKMFCNCVGLAGWLLLFILIVFAYFLFVPLPVQIKNSLTQSFCPVAL